MKRCIFIGKMDDKEDSINDLDLRKLNKKVQQLEEIVAEQAEIINALWYAPGMPGYNEAKERFDNNLEE